VVVIHAQCAECGLHAWLQRDTADGPLQELEHDASLVDALGNVLGCPICGQYGELVPAWERFDEPVEEVSATWGEHDRVIVAEAACEVDTCCATADCGE